MTTATTTTHPYGKAYGGSATENYERFFVTTHGRPLATDLVAEAALRPGERVLDVACGTGIVARLAADGVGPGGTVAGVDVNAGMLSVAKSVAGELPIRWYESPAESIPLAGDAFDVVLCQLALQFIDDKPAALREMRRVLAPNGRVLASVPTPNSFFDVMDEAMSRHFPAGAGFVRLVFSMHDPVELERLFLEAGFRDVRARPVTKVLRLPEPREFLWQYVYSTPMAVLAAEADDSVLAALEQDVVTAWQPWVQDGGVTYEQGLIVATARR